MSYFTSSHPYVNPRTLRGGLREAPLPGGASRRQRRLAEPQRRLAEPPHSQPTAYQQQISPYFNPTYTRTGWIGQPPARQA